MEYTQADVDRILGQLSKSQALPKTISGLLKLNDMLILAEEIKRLREECKRFNDAIYRIQSYHARGS